MKRKRTRTRRCLLHVVVFVLSPLSGCALGPEYTRPDVAVPPQYRFAPAPTNDPPPVHVTAWWSSFGDRRLDALVEEAVLANRDLGIATARVEEFAARTAAVRAEARPMLGYAAAAGRQRTPGGSPGDTYAGLLSARWELDLWGRLRRGREAAQAELMATEQARRGVALTLASAVVTGYITLLDLDRRLEIARSTLAGRGQSVAVFQLRLDGGAVSELEMLQVTAEYESAAAAIPELEQALAMQEHAVSVLVGRNPGPIDRSGTLALLQVPVVPPGLPSALLSRRPDILQSEQQLVAANARVGVARALYFPTLALTGDAGTASGDLDALFSGPARTWSFVGQLLGPIFAGGAIDAANRQADARHQQALLAYEGAIQNAFADVDDALAAIQANTTLVASLERRVSALRRAVGLAVERYDNGYADYLEVLDTERGLFAAELALSSAQGNRYRAVVALYQALGGDWREAPFTAPTASSAGRPERTVDPGRP